MKELLDRLKTLDPATSDRFWKHFERCCPEPVEDDQVVEDGILQAVLQEAIAARHWEYDTGYHFDQGDTPGYAWCFYDRALDRKVGKLEYGKTVPDALLKAYIAALESVTTWGEMDRKALYDPKNLEKAAAIVAKEQSETRCPVCDRPMVVLHGQVKDLGEAKGEGPSAWFEITHGCTRKGHCETTYVITIDEVS